MRVEVRASGLRAMRQRRGLTQRQLAKDLDVSQNYIPAIEANDRQPGPKLQQQMIRYFDCAFEDLFQVMLIDPETGREQLLQAASR